MSEGNYASEILADLRALTKKIWIVAIVLGIALVVQSAVFVWYIFNTEEYSVEASGIYTAVDRSVVTAQDVDPETWQMFLVWMDKNGEDENNR